MKLRNIVLSLAVISLLLSTVSFAQESEPAKSTETAASASHNASGVKIIKSALCQAVKDREPQEEVQTAKVGDVVVGWMQLQSTEDTTVTHRWMLNGQTISDVSLNVKTSPSFRAWSRKTIGSAGEWKWQILDSNGNVLKEVAFTVAAS